MWKLCYGFVFLTGGFPPKAKDIMIVVGSSLLLFWKFILLISQSVSYFTILHLNELIEF